MLTIEKDQNGEQIFVHGSPEQLRWLAAQLEAIATEAEKSGHAHDHFRTKEWAGGELTSDLQGGKESHEIVNHLVVYGWRND